METVEAQIKTFILARFPIIQLVTWEEERVLAELSLLAKSVKKTLRVWSCTHGLYSYAYEKANKEELQDPLSCLSEIIASPTSAIYVMLDFHAFWNNTQIIRKLRDAVSKLKASKKNMILLGPVDTLPLELIKDVVSLDFPLPSQKQIAQTLINLEKEETEKAQFFLNPREREDLIKSAQGLTQNELENVLSISLIQRKRIDRHTIPFLLEEKKQIIRKSGILEYVEVDHGLESVGGYRLLKEWIRKRSKALSNQAREFGIPSPKGLFLLGIQGCGKSLIAKTIARDWQLPLLRMDVGRVFSGIVGSSEHNIRRAIQVAETISPCILWVDEIEKAFAGVGSSNMSDAGTAARVFATFMTWLQEKKSPVFLVATANDLSVLPAELIRKGRFDEVFFLDLPGPKARKEVFSIHLTRFNRDETQFDLEALSFSSKGFSGAEIEQAIIDALYDAFEENRPVTTKDILIQLERTSPLSEIMNESISRLRSWAQHRTRSASDEVELSF